MKLLKDIMTGKDNQTHDISRVIMTVNMLALIPLLYIGIGFYLYGYYLGMRDPSVKQFDMQTFFNGVLTYIGALGTLLTTGAASLWMKKSTEPDGSSIEEMTINRNFPQNVTENVTTINKV